MIEKNTFVLPLWSFQGARGTHPPYRETPHVPADADRPGLSKLNSVRKADDELDILLGEPSHRTTLRERGI